MMLTHFPFIAFIDPNSSFNSFTVILKLASTPSMSINKSEKQFKIQNQTIKNITKLNKVTTSSQTVNNYKILVSFNNSKKKGILRNIYFINNYSDTRCN